MFSHAQEEGKVSNIYSKILKYRKKWPAKQTVQRNSINDCGYVKAPSSPVDKSKEKHHDVAVTETGNDESNAEEKEKPAKKKKK